MHEGMATQVLGRKGHKARGIAGRQAERSGTKAATSVDVHIGQRLRLRRKLAGLSQEQLAERVGVTFQQLQKYEKGTNRISASRLFGIAQVLSVPVSYFFEGLAAADAEPESMVPMTRDEHDLLLAYRSASEDVRGPVVALVQASRQQAERSNPLRAGRVRHGRRPLRHQKVAR